MILSFRCQHQPCRCARKQSPRVSFAAQSGFSLDMQHQPPPDLLSTARQLTQVLGVGLGDHDFQTLVHKEAWRKCVII